MRTLLMRWSETWRETTSPAERARKKLLRDPASCMRSFEGKPYNWNNALRCNGLGVYFMPDIWVRAGGQQLGYIQQISSPDEGRTIIIGHFGVGVEFVGKGVSHAIVQELRNCLISHLGTEIVRFEERHREFQDANYERFFRTIGAANLNPQKPRVWTWAIRKDYGYSREFREWGPFGLHGDVW